MKSKLKLHPKNAHKEGYDFKALLKVYPALQNWMTTNPHGNSTIDFSNPKAVRALNAALLKKYYGIIDWIFPEENLCPPIPGRVDYIHYLHDLLNESGLTKNIRVLDIGTGATCIYPLLGARVYDWNFVATDIELDSLDAAQDIIDDNDLDAKIELRQQFDENNILTGIIESDDIFSASMCNPPFYGSAEEARGANRRKTRNLGTNAVRNFAGNSNELWYIGGEKAFLHNYLYQSSLHQNTCVWFTSLVSKKENVQSLEKSATKLKATAFKVIPMHQGNKVTRIVAWSFQK
jgi:23S rRNA (adenine1618-N6)-methyltransferase